LANKLPPQLTQEQRRRFIEIRRRGRARYILYYGVLRFGVFWTILTGLLWSILVPGSYPPLGPRDLPRILAWIIYMIPFGVLGGWAYGSWMWRIFERNTRSMADDPPDGAPA